MTSRTLAFVAAAALLALCARAASAKYKVITVPKEKAGTIVGRVVFDGKPPAAKTLKVKHKDKVCHAKPLPDESLVVAKDGGIRWAVVHIKKIKAGKPFAKSYTPLDQKNCQFVPHVVMTPVERPLKVLNTDGILHNVHLRPKLNDETNRAMSLSKPIQILFWTKEIMSVKCDVHSWMSAWVVAMEHPYYATTGADGSFRLDGVPAGTYKLRVWHEKLGKKDVEITVKAGKESRIDFKLKSKG